MSFTGEQGQLHPLWFYQAVREHKPVRTLEQMRRIKLFCWEEDHENQSYTPAEGLLHAVVHDHRDYAEYLLNRFGDVALAMPGERFCRCPSSAPHLAEAVRYGRRDIMDLILQVVHRKPSLRSYIDRRGCVHLEDGKTPLHLACALTDSQAVTVLLGNGASTQVEDQNQMTPLDLILEQLQTSSSSSSSSVDTSALTLCLDRLIAFMPEVRFKLKRALKEAPRCWSDILGEENFNYLVGKNPKTLFLSALQRILRQLPPHEFAKSVDQLPVPTSLKLLPQN